MKRKWSELFGFVLLTFSGILVLFVLGVILFDIFTKGIGVISWGFLTESPRQGMTEGGIFPAILGTFLVSVITVLFAVPLGMFAAVYLHEYAQPGKLTRLIRLSIRNLSGVPSIVYGLFGVVVFVQMLSLKTSVLSAGLTLGLLTLPWTITACEEALKTVPKSYREGALALGAPKWYTIRTNVLPYAIPGMLTGMILGLARAAGETAPILFTGAAFFLPHLPRSLFDQFMALPYHLYILATQHHAIDRVRPIAYGTALVLLGLILLLSISAILFRYRYRTMMKG